jgi:hypothetical protein
LTTCEQNGIKYIVIDVALETETGKFSRWYWLCTKCISKPRKHHLGIFATQSSAIDEAREHNRVYHNREQGIRVQGHNGKWRQLKNER